MSGEISRLNLTMANIFNARVKVVDVNVAYSDQIQSVSKNYLVAATIFMAASVRSAAVCIMGISFLAASSNARAWTTLVPSKRTTSGT